MLLGRPGLQGRSLAQPEHLHIGRLASMGGGEVVHQRVLALLDDGGPLGELGHQGL